MREWTRQSIIEIIAQRVRLYNLKNKKESECDENGEGVDAKIDRRND